jgi:hypothetical protein
MGPCQPAVLGSVAAAEGPVERSEADMGRSPTAGGARVVVPKAAIARGS